MTAAPRMMVASGEDILPASIEVRAEIETLVAVSAPPRKQAVGQESPKRCPTPAPSRNGQMTPESATRKAVHACFPHAVDVGFKAGDEHQYKAAELRQEHQSAGGLAAREQMNVQQIEGARARAHADHQLAKNGGNSEAGTQRGGNLAGRQQDGEQQRKLKGRLHALTEHPVRRRFLGSAGSTGGAENASMTIQGRLVAAALDSFALHGPDGGRLPARQIRLGQILRQQRGDACAPRLCPSREAASTARPVFSWAMKLLGASRTDSRNSSMAAVDSKLTHSAIPSSTRSSETCGYLVDAVAQLRDQIRCARLFRADRDRQTSAAADSVFLRAIEASASDDTRALRAIASGHCVRTMSVFDMRH